MDKGSWICIFDKLFKELPDINIVVEDLGDLRDEVLELRDHYDFKGMRIVQFTFNPEGMDEDENLIIYTGTHDNQTVRGWYSTLKQKKTKVREYLKNNGFDYGSVSLNMIAYTLKSNAQIAIVPFMDVLNLTDKARLNTPGTVGNLIGNIDLQDLRD